MSEVEIEPLSREESVTLGLAAPVLHRRFAGRLIGWNKLPHEPGYVLAELACEPPPETIHDLATRDWATRDWATTPVLKVRLLWQPPIHVSPVFYPSLGMLGVGCAGLCAALLARSRRRRTPGAADTGCPAQAPQIGRAHV